MSIRHIPIFGFSEDTDESMIRKTYLREMSEIFGVEILGLKARRLKTKNGAKYEHYLETRDHGEIFIGSMRNLDSYKTVKYKLAEATGILRNYHVEKDNWSRFICELLPYRVISDN